MKILQMTDDTLYVDIDGVTHIIHFRGYLDAFDNETFVIDSTTVPDSISIDEVLTFLAENYICTVQPFVWWNQN